MNLFRVLPQALHEQAVTAERQLRAPLPVLRRIAFTSLSGGTGCTSVTIRTAALLAGRRGGRVLHVDASHAECRAEPTVVPHVDTVRVPAPSWPGGLEIWRQHCAELHRRYELTLTDWGVLGLRDLPTVAGHSHLMCLTTTMERIAVQRALDVAAFLRDSGTPTLLVVSAVRGRPTIGARRMLAAVPMPAHFLPYDPNVRRPSTTVVSDRSLLSLAKFGAAIVSTSTYSEQAGTA